ncbi:hypothetical protein DBO86_16835 [Pseudomonas indoloxydans]|uniref:Uncharacterized protein n=1 Tax=Ectopseudomonas oleovorans TaxID=301 RepID=A0A2T5PJS8_ECTOL|nr:hypothetical protein DBO86_16835 [Pseudomonas indoloxydans]TRO37816.1 hypothetical protein EQ831_15805 [Pseudomonas sp. ALS1279]
METSGHGRKRESRQPGCAFSRAFVPPCNPAASRRCMRSPTLGPATRLLTSRNPSRPLRFATTDDPVHGSAFRGAEQANAMPATGQLSCALVVLRRRSQPTK